MKRIILTLEVTTRRQDASNLHSVTLPKSLTLYLSSTFGPPTNPVLSFIPLRLVFSHRLRVVSLSPYMSGVAPVGPMDQKSRSTLGLWKQKHDGPTHRLSVLRPWFDGPKPGIKVVNDLHVGTRSERVGGKGRDISPCCYLYWGVPLTL